MKPASKARCSTELTARFGRTMLHGRKWAQKHADRRVLFKPYFVGDRDYVDSKGIQWRTLRSLVDENGHDWIDILEVDIEDSEYATLTSIMEDFDVLPFSQLQIELHVDTKHTTFDNFLTWWERLEAKGLRPFWTEVNLHPAIHYPTPWASEYCFINTRGEKNTLLRDYE